CGKFPNVPLLGMRGGISYSPILVRRQFGYPMKDKPNSLLLTSVFYLNQEGSSDMRNSVCKPGAQSSEKRRISWEEG
ncbi:hypothetical protein A2U01_0068794, partial [Trifolium medium]|nr:hypothetical protein [Trifolium medium]